MIEIVYIVEQRDYESAISDFAENGYWAVDLPAPCASCYIRTLSRNGRRPSGCHVGKNRCGLGDRVIDFHLLGEVDFEDVLRLQRRLVYELSAAGSARTVVLLCEHSPLVTIGRSGSREHIKLTNDELARRQLSMRWVDRTGGCVVHTPGQLAIYPIVPLPHFGWREHDFRQRLQRTGRLALEEIGITSEADSRLSGLWGRTGMLAAIGTSMQDETTFGGMFINVAPDMSTFGFVETATGFVASGEKTTMSCLLAERRQPVRMSKVRSALIEQFVTSFECDRHNIHTGHVWLQDRTGSERERTAYTR